jgi:aminopeptidase N
MPSQRLPLTLTLTLLLFAGLAGAQQSFRTPIDVTNYNIQAELIPAEHLIKATGEITFIPQNETRSVTFELNGSLKVQSVERDRRPLTNIAQDPIGIESLGPHFRVDLGSVVPKGQPVTIKVRWEGALVSPEGGPLPTKRLAYIGTEGSYLMYAARWFPFNDYFADRATGTITLTVPAGNQVAAWGGSASGTKTVINYPQPALIGNIALGQYMSRKLNLGGSEIDVFVKAGNEKQIEKYAETAGKALQFYTTKYGPPLMGRRFVIAQIDDLSLDTYSGPGMLFLSSRLFDQNRGFPEEKIQREVAYQWWGHTVGIRSFDDVWLSQGLGEWSAFAYRESTLKDAALEAAQRDELERALVFTKAASISRAPQTLDDQSAAFASVVIYKGALVFRMLRETLGKDKFDQLIKTYFEEFRGKNGSIEDFEKLTSRLAGRSMRQFFAQWIEGTEIPEFSADYQIIRTRTGKFRARGTVKQNLENLNMPVEVMLKSEGDQSQTKVIYIEGNSEDFDFEASGKPLEVIVDPNNKILHQSEELRISVAARKGIEFYRDGQYAEAQKQLEEALKLDRSSSWIYYHLGLIHLEQRDYQPALDNFQAALDGNLKPQWIEAWARIKRGNAYDARGDRTRAVAEYNKAVQSGINYDNAQAVAKFFIATPYDPRKKEQSPEVARDQ